MAIKTKVPSTVFTAMLTARKADLNSALLQLSLCLVIINSKEGSLEHIEHRGHPSINSATP